MNLTKHIIHHEILGVSSGSGGAGSIIVQDEGVTVGTFPVLNFTGSDVRAVGAGSRADIQIPPTNYSPFFNQSGCVVPNIATSSRNVASPTTEGSPYNIGSWASGSLQSCSNAGSIVYQTPSLFSIKNNTSTTIKVDIIDADGATVLATHTETLVGNLDITTDNIRIEITGFTTDSDKYKANFRTTINLAAILPQGGRYSVRITHTNTGDGGPYVKLQSDIFYDPNPINPTITNPTISETTPNIVYISGINFYGIGSTFTTTITDIDNINDRSYVSPFINILGTEFGLPQLNLSGANLSGWSSIYNVVDASYLNTAWGITQSNYYAKGNLKVQARWIDWSTNALQNSSLYSAIISTYTSNETRIYEDFRNESRRLRDTYAVGWDSAQSLETYSGGTGLQAINSLLIYPQEDFTIYNPNPASQKDYTGLTGDRFWNGFFYHTNVSHSNGIFRFSGHNLSNTKLVNKDIDIQISLDKISWYTLSQDYLGGSLSHGSGCRVEPDVYSFELNNQLKFTLGTGKFTDVSSDWGIWYKIIYKDNINGRANYINSFEILDWV